MAFPLRRQNADLTATAAGSAASSPDNGELGLDALLAEEGYRFDFFQAVRVLHKLLPERQPVGGDALPGDEVVRFHAYLSMAFPPSEVYDIAAPKIEGRPIDMTVAFMGLTGPSGALPRCYTELLMERVRVKDRTARDFFDLFNHRLISLFYRAWEKYRFWAAYERAEVEGRARLSVGADQHRAFVIDERPQMDLFSDCLLDLAGLGPPALRYRLKVRDHLERRTAIGDETLRFYVGLLSQQHRSAVGLEGLLADYFGLPVEVAQFSGQWLQLEPENQSCLVEDGNVRLGVNVVIGERFWDRQGKFRIRLGPLTYPQFHDFLPLGTAFRPLAHLARLYAGQPLDIDVQLILRADEVPWCRLGHSDDDSRLGWNTWIRSNPFTHDVADAVFAVHDN